MRSLKEWSIRHIGWRLPGRRTKWDNIFRGGAAVNISNGDRPRIGNVILDDWQLQTIAMCPAGSKLKVKLGASALEFEVDHPGFIEPNQKNLVEIRVDRQRVPYLYYDHILFETSQYSGFGAVAFYRAAQAAKRVGFPRIELLAAGGLGYKIAPKGWSRAYNGFYSWARYGFDAALHPKTLKMLAGHATLSHCTRLLDIIDAEPEWWRQNGDGCVLTFDLASGSRSWYTLTRYLKERGLK